MRESGKLIWRLVSVGAHFYVCGDAAHMAGAVEEALLSILAQHLVREGDVRH
jgi:sulfite reductase (NADPH) flavoprotein alpha-component